MAGPTSTSSFTRSKYELLRRARQGATRLSPRLLIRRFRLLLAVGSETGTGAASASRMESQQGNRPDGAIAAPARADVTQCGLLLRLDIHLLQPPRIGYYVDRTERHCDLSKHRMHDAEDRKG